MSYQGKILRVNLSNGKADAEPLNLEWAKDFYGGKGLGIKYLYEETQAGLDPLSPNNKLILMTGPFTGTCVPCSGKLAIISKSPATNTILDCSIGGHFASELKFAGYDGVIIEGKSPVPVYLLINNNDVTINDASSLWGKGIFETEDILLQEYGKLFKVLSIGQAGENLVPFSCIGSDYYRQAGRGGIGAVMGSKNLKAIVCHGTGSVKISKPDKVLSVAQKYLLEDTLSEKNLWAADEGTPVLVEMTNAAGILPTFNFQDGMYDGASLLGVDQMKSHRKHKRACFSCGLGCGNYIDVNGQTIEGPEYETLALCGSNCGIKSFEAVVKFNKLCDDLGLDTISTGNIVGFCMELNEKKIRDFGLTFGDIEKYLEIPKLIANKQGIGKELALGVKGLGQKYNANDFAMQVKGLEMPGYDPRGSWGMGLAYATSDRGACHMRAWPVADEAFGEVEPFTEVGKAQLVIDGQNYNAIKFSLILCDFWALSFASMAQLLSVVLDKDISSDELVKGGVRIWNLSRIFNAREGFTNTNDSLPKRIFTEKLVSGKTAGKYLPRDKFDSMLTEYYHLRDWDESGIPKSRI